MLALIVFLFSVMFYFQMELSYLRIFLLSVVLFIEMYSCIVLFEALIVWMSLMMVLCT